METKLTKKGIILLLNRGNIYKCPAVNKIRQYSIYHEAALKYNKSIKTLLELLKLPQDLK